jgi:E3 ubiquitin-protein ligase NEDD4
MLRRVQEQYAAFMEGLHDFVPQDLLSSFDEREVELLIGGIAQSKFQAVVRRTVTNGIYLQLMCMYFRRGRRQSFLF